MRMGNPTLNDQTFKETITMHSAVSMTMQGVMQKTGVLFLLLLLAAGFVWDSFMVAGEFTSFLTTLFVVSLIVSIIFAIITIFSKKNSMYTAPVYAIAEGVLLGTISAFFELMFPGIVIQAVAATLVVFGTMLLLYRNKIIKVTPRFTKVMIFALVGVLVTYLISFIISLFGVSIPLFGNGPIGILFSVVVAGIAAFTLLLDFNRIEQGVKHKAPKYMEWYSGFSLMVTLVWLYLEILKLLAKLQSRN